MANRVSIEIWDHIASFVANPPDLLHFALTSSRFRALIIPAHLHYCAVSTDAYNDAFWTDLTLKKAGRLRELNIMGFSVEDYYFTQAFGTDDDFLGVYKAARFPRRTRCIIPRTTPEEFLCLDCAKTATPVWVTSMSKSASAMSGLRSVAMRVTLCDVARLSRCTFFRKFHCPQLETFELALDRCNEAVDEGRMNEAITGLQELQGGYVSFSLKCNLGESANRRVMAVILLMLDSNCRELRHLHMQISRPHSSDFDIKWLSFWNATWPRLQSLSLNGMRIAAEDSEAVSGFLHRHRRIEVMQFERLYQETVYLDLYGALPDIRVVEIDGLDVGSVRCLLENDDGNYRPIESLLFEAQGDAERILEAVDAICQHGARVGSVRRLSFTAYTNVQPSHRIWLRMIAQCNPQLRDLTVDPSEICPDESEWHEMLAWFPNLEVLNGYEPDCWVVYHGEDEDEDDVAVPNIAEVIRELQVRLPKLRQFDDWVKESDKVWKMGSIKLKIGL